MKPAGRVVKARAWAHAPLGGLMRLGGLALDLIYPPACACCDAPLAQADALCAACFAGLLPITAPYCPVMGLPFSRPLGPDARSAEALAEPPPFRRARAALVYNAGAQALVGKLKYGDRPELARLCARLMAGAGADLWAENPVLVPVPLHPLRRIGRRYNQSAEIAHALGRITGLDVDETLARRTRRTRQQVGLSARGRAQNVAGAFAAHPRFLERAGGRPIVLIDDVYTTGSTLKALTRALRRAGAQNVDCLTFARVVIGADMPI